MKENLPQVSVIVTTRNERDNIANCLNSVKLQSYPSQKIEIIVVDNNSTDDTKQISAGFTERIYNFGPERSSQRNFGIKEAIGKYILFLDADMSLSENVLSECVELAQSQGLVALYIPERILGKGFWAKVRDFERTFYNATVIDCVRFIKRGSFLEIGGFDESMSGPEDWDFDRRIKATGKTGIIQGVLYHNEYNFNLVRYLKKKQYYARSFNKYIDKWGKTDATVKKQLGGSYRFFGVFFENGKWKRTAAHPLLILGVYFLKLMIGVGYLRQLNNKETCI